MHISESIKAALKSFRGRTFPASVDDLSWRFDALIESDDRTRSELQSLRAELAFLRRRLDDISLQIGRPFADPEIVLATDFSIAVASTDHICPRGTATDNTRHPRFVRASEQIFKRKLSALDIGCAGGGLVFDFLQRGHLALGIEGSDFSLKAQRAYWPLLPSHLMTCDATKPFRLLHESEPKRFDLVTAWEVLEHIPEELLGGFFSNIRDHLSDEGLFVASVATFPDFDPATGVAWHVTIKERDWWEAKMRENGLVAATSPYELLDYPRGSGNPLVVGDWNAATDPQSGFHIAARRAGA
jgi:2-polyprenyl-3-methyl-5-hydroxy-6-metoxy-1,4-benzoquinol methylase